MVFNKVGPDSSFAGYPVGAGYRISGWITCWIPDIRLDILPDTGYFNACSLFDRVTQIIETSQIFKQEQKCSTKIRFAGYPAGYLETGYPVFNIRYPAGYRILNRISGLSPKSGNSKVISMTGKHTTTTTKSCLVTPNFWPISRK